jgi:LemA protein
VAWFVVAVSLSWATGAYNRLVRLRAKGLLAFAVLEQTLHQQMSLISTNFLEDALVMDDAPQEWHDLLACTRSVNAAVKVAHLQPLNSEAASDLKSGVEDMGLHWRQLVSLPPDLAGSFLPLRFQLEWEQLAFQVASARSDFNQSVINYNEARDQFPANVLANIFGFKTAQPV